MMVARAIMLNNKPVMDEQCEAEMRRRAREMHTTGLFRMGSVLG